MNHGFTNRLEVEYLSNLPKRLCGMIMVISTIVLSSVNLQYLRKFYAILNKYIK